VAGVHLSTTNPAAVPDPTERRAAPVALCRHGHGAHDWRTLALLSALCLTFGAGAFAAERFAAPAWLTACLFALSYVFGAWDAARESTQLLRHGEVEIHFLMLFVALGAALVGAWSEGALLLFLFSASAAMEQFASASHAA
jgi:Cd2+/Zn2+-exporting ATPase